MKSPRVALIVLAVTLASGTGIVLASGASASTSTTCNEQTTAGDVIRYVLPSRDGDLNCYLWNGNAYAHNDAVRALQRALNQCYGVGLTVDGSFGPKTESALEHVQSSAGITADGKYGPQTRDHLKWPSDSASGCAYL